MNKLTTHDTRHTGHCTQTQTQTQTQTNKTVSLKFCLLFPPLLRAATGVQWLAAVLSHRGSEWRCLELEAPAPASRSDVVECAPASCADAAECVMQVGEETGPDTQPASSGDVPGRSCFLSRCQRERRWVPWVPKSVGSHRAPRTAAMAATQWRVGANRIWCRERGIWTEWGGC